MIKLYGSIPFLLLFHGIGWTLTFRVFIASALLAAITRHTVFAIWVKKAWRERQMAWAAYGLTQDSELKKFARLYDTAETIPGQARDWDRVNQIGAWSFIIWFVLGLVTFA